MNKMKRKKDKYNPYTLKDNQIISFIDSHGYKNDIKVSYKIYELFNNFELQDKRQMNEYDRHIEHLEQSEELLYKNIQNKDEYIEDIVIKNILYTDLYKAIEKLPINQKRRLKMYYFNNMTLKQIAKLENCSHQAIKYSLECGIKNLRRILK